MRAFEKARHWCSLRSGGTVPRTLQDRLDGVLVDSRTNFPLDDLVLLW